MVAPGAAVPASVFATRRWLGRGAGGPRKALRLRLRERPRSSVWYVAAEVKSERRVDVDGVVLIVKRVWPVGFGICGSQMKCTWSPPSSGRLPSTISPGSRPRSGTIDRAGQEGEALGPGRGRRWCRRDRRLGSLGQQAGLDRHRLAAVEPAVAVDVVEADVVGAGDEVGGGGLGVLTRAVAKGEARDRRRARLMEVSWAKRPRSSRGRRRWSAAAWSGARGRAPVSAGAGSGGPGAVRTGSETDSPSRVGRPARDGFLASRTNGGPARRIERRPAGGRAGRPRSARSNRRPRSPRARGQRARGGPPRRRGLGDAPGRSAGRARGGGSGRWGRRAKTRAVRRGRRGSPRGASRTRPSARATESRCESQLSVLAAHPAKAGLARPRTACRPLVAAGALEEREA